VRWPLLLVLTACEGTPLERFTLGDAAVMDARGDSGVFVADSGRLDATDFDGGQIVDVGVEPTDAGVLDSGVEPQPCGFEADLLGDRMLLIGEPFSPNPEVPGTRVRRLVVGEDGMLRNSNEHLDVGFRPQRIEIMPRGDWALVLGEDGELASVSLGATMQVVDQVSLPGAGYGDLRLSPADGLVWVVGSNVNETSGISTVRLSCNGMLETEARPFFPMRLASSLALLPQGRAVLLGGQTVFEPVDPLDVRLLSFEAPGWRQVQGFDLWMDFIDAERIDASPDGRWLFLPNGSPFSKEGNEVMVAVIAGDQISEAQRFSNLEDAREALFSPDGATVLVSLLSPGQVAVFEQRVGGFEERRRIRGIGLAEQMALVRRDRLAGRVYVTSVDPNGGPNIAILQIEGPGQVTDLGQFELGSGLERIPGALAVTP